MLALNFDRKWMAKKNACLMIIKQALWKCLETQLYHTP